MEKSNQSFMERPNIEELVTTKVILLHQLFCIYLIYGKFNGTLSFSLNLKKKSFEAMLYVGNGSY